MQTGSQLSSSVSAGGEVGNIALQVHREIGEEVSVPAESGGDRAEHAAELQYMELEVDALGAKASHTISHGGGSIGGDAPAAGNGMQISGNGEKQGEHATLHADRPPAADF